MKKLALVLLPLLGTGCAIIVNTPSVRFDTPEARGKLGKGYIGIGGTVTKAVTVVSLTTSTPPATQPSQDSGLSIPIFGGLGILERLDLELKGQPAYAYSGATSPTLLRAKYQILGRTRAQNDAGFEAGPVLATTFGGGFSQLSTSNHQTTPDVTARGETLTFAGDLGAVGGYRFTSWYLLYTGVAYTFYSVAGTITQSGSTTGSYPFSGLIHHASADLGMRFDIAFFWVQLEGALSYATLGSSSGPVLPTVGGALGFQW